MALEDLKVYLEAELPSYIWMVADEIFDHEKCSDIICSPSECFNWHWLVKCLTLNQPVSAEGDCKFSQFDWPRRKILGMICFSDFCCRFFISLIFADDYLEFIALQHRKVYLEAELPSYIWVVADEIFDHDKCWDIISCPSECFNWHWLVKCWTLNQPISVEADPKFSMFDLPRTKILWNNSFLWFLPMIIWSL